MGYMGFGMRKEVYTRKPKQPFVKLRKLYEAELNSNKPISKTNIPRFTSQQVKDAKIAVREKIKKQKIKETIALILILIVCFWIVSLI